MTPQKTHCRHQSSARGDNKPYAANKTDYWIKVGADKRRASREELKRLMQETGWCIGSPGKLPNMASIENIKQGIQIARNPILLSYVPKLKIPYRGIGSGIRRMISECESAD